MVKMLETPEGFDRADSTEKFKNIKPTEKMSDKEADDFWAAEFEKAQAETEIDTYDKLLSEVFNRFEEELDIDFTITDRISDVLEKFRSDDWDLMDIKEKVSIAKELVKAIGKELQIDNLPEVELLQDEDDADGSFGAIENKISLNIKNFNNPVELVDTIAHEVRHAYQHMRAEIMDTWEDALYKVNFDNYISPLPLPGGGWLFFVDYMTQYVEVDARAFANLFTEAMRYE